MIDYPVSSGCAPSIAVGSDGSLYTAGSIFGGDFTTSRYINDIDRDSDGTFDALDNCPTTPNPLQENADGDIYGDSCDNCRTVTNEDQAITITMTGDVNRDSVITSADMIYLVNNIFKGGFAPLPCAGAGDVNCSGSITTADIIELVGFVFKGADPPCDVCEGGNLGWSCP